jgi:hypothetical protein
VPCPCMIGESARKFGRYPTLPEKLRDSSQTLTARKANSPMGLRPRPTSPPSDREIMTLDTLSNGHCSGSITPKGPASSGCVVQKFGGTSVGKFAPDIVTHVIKPSLVKDHVVVVCSAASATVKMDGTTNR